MGRHLAASFYRGMLPPVIPLIGIYSKTPSKVLVCVERGGCLKVGPSGQMFGIREGRIMKFVLMLKRYRVVGGVKLL
jgi:hypothetical protein